LNEAERIFYSDLDGTFDNKGFSDGIRFEEVLEGATHGTASSLGLYLHEIETLLPHTELRQKYLQLTNDEFEAIINQEWSLALVKQIHAQLQGRERLELEEVSELIKEIQHEQSKLQP
jgi:hypothetical protein